MAIRTCFINSDKPNGLVIICRILAVSAIWLVLTGCDKNHPPVISSIICLPESRSAGTLYTLTAAASDEDGDALQYRWSADGGLFPDSINRNQVIWKSPVDGNGKSYTVKVTVSDGKAESSLDYPIVLTEPVFGQVSGYAFFTNCMVPVAGAVITVDDKNAITDSTGFFNIPGIPVGSYTLKASLADFSPYNLKVNVQQSVNLRITVSLTSVVRTSKLSGLVTDLDGLPVSGVKVTMLNPDKSESKILSTSNASGFYSLWYVPLGQRKITLHKDTNAEFGYADTASVFAVTDPEYAIDLKIRKYPLAGQFLDRRDNHLYAYKIIGTQTWMAENLAYLPAIKPSSAGNDVDKIYYVYGYEGTSVSAAKAEFNYTVYGVLYNWQAAQEACPQGWHLPSNITWDILTGFLGTPTGKMLKSQSNWNNHGNGDNSSGFSAIPGGQRLADGGFLNIGDQAKFWSTSLSGSFAVYQYLTGSSNDFFRSRDYGRAGLSVRCLKD